MYRTYVTFVHSYNAMLKNKIQGKQITCMGLSGNIIIHMHTTTAQNCQAGDITDVHTHTHTHTS